LTWTSFDYTTADNLGIYNVEGSINIKKSANDTLMSIAYALDLSNGYHYLAVSSIAHSSGFLILGYVDQTEQFTVFILNTTNLLQQAYLPNSTSLSLLEDVYKYSKFFNNSLTKVNIYYQEFYIPTYVLHEISSSVSYNFGLLSNNTLILGDYDYLWSTDLTPLLNRGIQFSFNLKLYLFIFYLIYNYFC